MSVLTRLGLYPEGARVTQHGHLSISGVDAVELAREYGTPLYVYDQAAICVRYGAYRDALAAHYPASAGVAYAAKAFLCAAVARLVEQQGMSLDVVSGGELYIALRAGFPAARIHFHGNAKTQSELELALDAGVGRIVVDNHAELEALSRLAAERGRPVRVWVRVSPGVDAHTHVYRKTGLVDCKFGFPLATGDAARALGRAMDDPYLVPMGLHAHVGSQIVESEPFVQAVRQLLGLAAEMRGHGFELCEISPGGGLGVRYVEDDPLLSIESYVQAVCTAIVQACSTYGLPLPHLVLEPGRSIVGPAGVALYTVCARKEIPAVRIYVSVDGGMGDNLRPALYGALYTALVANKADHPSTERVTVAGRFCESGDVLCRDVELARAEPGDLLAIPVSGAYQLSMSSDYNRVPRPAAVLVQMGHAQLILRRETYDDLVRRDV